jgi:hypothetical protein
LSGQCRGGASYNCKKKGEQNNKTCEDREFNSIKAACWQRLALDKILISKGCEYQTVNGHSTIGFANELVDTGWLATIVMAAAVAGMLVTAVL